MARREAREYRECLSAEQRGQPGCPARESCREPRGQDTNELSRLSGQPIPAIASPLAPHTEPARAKRVGRALPLRVLAFVAVACGVIQIGSAACVVRDFETPNASAAIGRSLALGHGYRYPANGALAYHLPGEPLYLAAAFRVLPERAWRYIHVPVTLLLVTSIAAAGLAVGGPPLAMAAGLVASVDPFVVAHGPVWDDLFLGVALDWTIFALLLRAATMPPRRSAAAVVWLAVFSCAGAAALTRLESLLVLGGVAASVSIAPRLRPFRRLAFAMVAGMTLALGAWGARNAGAVGHFLVGSTHDGKTLEESTGPLTRRVILTDGRAGGSSDTIVAGTDEVERDRQFARDAWRYVSTHPIEFVETAALKVAVSAIGLDLGQPARSARNVAALVSSMVLLVIGVYGLRSLGHSGAVPGRDLLAAIVGATALATLSTLMLGPVGMRYRLGLSACLYLGGGAAARRIASAAAAPTL